LPTSGWDDPRSLVLPVFSLALGPIAGFARYMRNSLIGVLREDYIRTGYAKGGSTWQVIFSHAFRNSLIPLITVAGPQFAFLMVGTVWIESMFNIPGLGSLFATAAPMRDYPLIIASSAFFALLIMVINLLVDVSYAYLDPRIRAGYAAHR
jgi:peptide/nickel transport system permease protein